MAYRFFVFKEKLIITIMKIMCLIAAIISIYFVYNKQNKYYIALIIGNLVLILISSMLSKVTDQNVENALKIKGNFILDGKNNGYVVNNLKTVFNVALFITVITNILVAFFGSKDLVSRILTLNKYEGFLYIFIFIIFYNVFNICNFISNITLKKSQNKIFDALKMGRISQNTKEIKNITINGNRIYGIFLNKETELLFDEKSPSFKYLLSAIQRNEELKEEEPVRDPIYGGLNYDNSQNNF